MPTGVWCWDNGYSHLIPFPSNQSEHWPLVGFWETEVMRKEERNWTYYSFLFVWVSQNLKNLPKPSQIVIFGLVGEKCYFLMLLNTNICTRKLIFLLLFASEQLEFLVSRYYNWFWGSGCCCRKGGHTRIFEGNRERGWISCG